MNRLHSISAIINQAVASSFLSSSLLSVSLYLHLSHSFSADVSYAGLVHNNQRPQERESAEVEKEEVMAQEIEQEQEKPEQEQLHQPIQEELKKEPEEQEREAASTGGTGRRPSLHHTASPIRLQRNGACCHSTTSDYELSLDLKNKQVGSKALWDCGLEEV